ncbi:hypothetical protein H0O00_03220 [Candidatus Micrarchaeota archaeon]|nr:hypothetical protein [Candidatus Micrarchaeota archaeon]
MAGAKLKGREVVGSDAPVLAMAKGFGRYKPEEEKPVRKVEVSGDELSYLRRRREMLRSMTVEQILQVIEFHKDLNVFQALKLAKKQGKFIVPNYILDRILTETGKRHNAWTGTAVIYETPDKPFAEKVVYSWDDANVQYFVTFEVPQPFRGKTNCILVVEHPDFDIVSLGDNNFQLKAAEGSVSLLERFPKKRGDWYGYDKTFRIPVGRPKQTGDSSRRLWRVNYEYVGLVSLDCRDYGGRRGVDLNYAPSLAFGVALF